MLSVETLNLRESCDTDSPARRAISIWSRPAWRQTAQGLPIVLRVVTSLTALTIDSSDRGLASFPRLIALDRLAGHVGVFRQT